MAVELVTLVSDLASIIGTKTLFRVNRQDWLRERSVARATLGPTARMIGLDEP